MEPSKDSTSATTPTDATPAREGSTKTFKSVRELKSTSTPPSVTYSHYDNKYKCCCGSVHVKQGALLIAFVLVGICLFDLISLVVSTQTTISFWASVVSVVLQLICAVLVIIAIKKLIPQLMLPNIVLLAASVIVIIVGVGIFLWAAFDPKSIGGAYIKQIIEAEQEEVQRDHNEDFGHLLLTMVSVFMVILLSLAAIVCVWWLQVNYACYQYLHDKKNNHGNVTVKFSKDVNLKV